MIGAHVLVHWECPVGGPSTNQMGQKEPTPFFFSEQAPNITNQFLQTAQQHKYFCGAHQSPTPFGRGVTSTKRTHCIFSVTPSASGVPQRASGVPHECLGVPRSAPHIPGCKGSHNPAAWCPTPRSRAYQMSTSQWSTYEMGSTTWQHQNGSNNVAAGTLQQQHVDIIRHWMVGSVDGRWPSTLCYYMIWHAMIWYVMLCCVMLCYVMLC